MIKRLLIPLDGSKLAEAVLPASAMLAARLGASVCLIHVIEKNAPRRVHDDAHLNDPVQAERYLDDTAGRFFGDRGRIEKHVHSVEVADVARSIVQHAGEFSSDLIMLCTHGGVDARELLGGSLAQQVVGLGVTPVFLFRVKSGVPAAGISFERFLVPLDGKDEHRAGLDLAADLARACGAALHLLLVVDTFESVAGGLMPVTRLLPGSTRHLLDLEADQGSSHLAGKKLELEARGFTVTTSVCRGDPARNIGKQARATGAGLIVLGTHGKKGTTAFWSGSVAAKICRSCDVPLVLAPESRGAWA